MKTLKTILIIGVVLFYTAGCSFVTDESSMNQNQNSNITNKEEEKQEPSISTEPDEQESEEKDDEQDSEENDSTEKDDEQDSETQGSEEKDPEENLPEQKDPELNPETPNTPSIEDPKQNNYAEIIQQAVVKTESVDSVYFTRQRTGIYPENAKIKYSKSQNRRWYLNGEVEEYLEGIAGRYTTEFNAVKYFYQTWWSKNSKTKEWERKGSLHATFGISELGYLKQIKSVKKLNIERCPYDVYEITLDQKFANTASENLLNTTNMFNRDVIVTVMIDRDGYIRSIDCNWKKEVLNNPSIGPVTISVHIGDFDKTKIERPRDLKEEPVDYPDSRDELTPTKKEAIKDIIYAAYEKTYHANSATYELNGKKVKYDIPSNSALIESTDGAVTYYKGADGKYVDYNMVTSEYQQDSWTKFSGSDTWVQNVKKHTCFIPRELYFLKLIFDISKVEVEGDQTTYTIEILTQAANNAYSYSYDTADSKFSSNVTFTVSIDQDGYVRKIHIDSNDYRLDLSINNINSTTVVKPSNI